MNKRKVYFDSVLFEPMNENHRCKKQKMCDSSENAPNPSLVRKKNKKVHMKNQFKKKQI